MQIKMSNELENFLKSIYLEKSGISIFNFMYATFTYKIKLRLKLTTRLQPTKEIKIIIVHE